MLNAPPGAFLFINIYYMGKSGDVVVKYFCQFYCYKRLIITLIR